MDYSKFQQAWSLSQQNIWISSITTIIFAVSLIFLINFIVRQLILTVYRKIPKTPLHLLYGIDALPEIITPLRIAIWICSISHLVDFFAFQFNFIWGLATTQLIRSISVTLTISWILIRWKNRTQKAWFQANKNSLVGVERAKIDFIGKIVTIIITLLTVVTLLSKLGYPLEGLLTISGVGAAAIGFASKDVVSNFFSGVMVYFTQPFKPGERVFLESIRIEGSIERIGWYLTVLKNVDQQPVYIPNTIFSNSVVTNRTRMTHRKINDTIGVRYEDIDGIALLTQSILTYLRSHPQLDTSLSPVVSFNKFGEFSLNIQVIAYTRTLDYQEFIKIQQEILLHISTLVKEHKMEIAYPTQNIAIINPSKE